MNDRVGVVLLDVNDLDKLERLRDAVMILCNPDRWTPERTAAWHKLTGKDAARYIDLYDLAREADCERY